MKTQPSKYFVFSFQLPRRTPRFLTLMFFIFLLFKAHSTYAATITVTTTNNTGSGSLSQAIADAQDGDSIDFDLSSCPCTIFLSAPGPSTFFINKNISINGPGSHLLTISGANVEARIFVISSIVSLKGLTITEGETGGFSPGDLFGGGIVNSGTLTLDDCGITGNKSDTRGASRAGGIYNGGTLVITNSTISNNSGGGTSGGIENLGTLIISNSTITGNSALNGGGITNRGLLEITNTTISGNSAYDAGGILNSGFLTINNSTVTGNICIRAGCGILLSSDNESINNSIVAGNFAGSIPNDITDIFNLPAIIENASYNIIGNAATAGGIIDGLNGNMVGVNGAGTIDTNLILDPMLADNGGPTPTHKLRIGSPAIDAGNSTLTNDQRGFIRPVDFTRSPNGSGNLADIGAFEVQEGDFYNFSGFFSPVNMNEINLIRGGASVPIKFSLGGFQGNAVISNAVSTQIPCDGNSPAGSEIPADSAGESGLSYDAVTDTYIYVWKTAKSWSGTCRRLAVTLDDGAAYTADFQFR